MARTNQKTWNFFVLIAYFVIATTTTSISAAEIPLTLASTVPTSITTPNATIATDKNDNKLDNNNIPENTLTAKNSTLPGNELNQQTLPQNSNIVNQTTIPKNDNTSYVSDTPSIDDIAGLNKPNVEALEADDLNKPLPLEDEDLARTVFNNDTFGLPENSDFVAVNKNNKDIDEMQSGNNEDTRKLDNEDNLLKDVNNDKFILDDGPLVSHTQDGGVTAQIPVITASIFVILCIVGYTAMLMWRRHLERKYGNREMLVNEEFDPSDMRHFSI